MTNYHLFPRFVLVLALALLQGCGGGSSSNPPPPPPPPPPTGPEFLYVGTTNSQPGNPTEIVGFPINSSTGALGTPTVLATGPVLGSVGDPFGRALYTADGTGAIHEYTINGTTGALTEVSASPFPVPTSPPLTDPTPLFGPDPYTDLMQTFWVPVQM